MILCASTGLTPKLISSKRIDAATRRADVMIDDRQANSNMPAKASILPVKHDNLRNCVNIKSENKMIRKFPPEQDFSIIMAVAGGDVPQNPISGTKTKCTVERTPESHDIGASKKNGASDGA